MSLSPPLDASTALVEIPLALVGVIVPYQDTSGEKFPAPSGMWPSPLPLLGRGTCHIGYIGNSYLLSGVMLLSRPYV